MENFIFIISPTWHREKSKSSNNSMKIKVWKALIFRKCCHRVENKSWNIKFILDGCKIDVSMHIKIQSCTRDKMTFCKAFKL